MLGSSRIRTRAGGWPGLSAKPALCEHGLAASVKQALWWPPVAARLKHSAQAGPTSAVTPVGYGEPRAQRAGLSPAGWVQEQHQKEL